MEIDTPLVLSFLYILVTSNIYGWGLQHNQVYIVSIVFLGIVYLLSNTLLFFKKEGLVLLIKVICLLLFITVGVFGITGSFIQLRQISSVVGFVNDSALQTEIAGRFLLLGDNPYSQNFVHTDLAKWKYKDEAGNTRNPALYSNVIPPFMITISAVGFRIFSRVLGWFDVRFITLSAYFLLLLLGFVKFWRKKSLLYFLILVGMQPLFLSSMMEGSNDIVVVLFLLSGLFFLERKNLLLSGLLLGLSITTKQTAWFAAPFYLVYLLQRYRKKDMLRFLLPYGAITAAFYLPFALWNFSALVSNLVFYVSYQSLGAAPIHPIEGYGFGILLHNLGLIHSIYAQYPFWLYQAVFGGLLLAFFLWIQFKKRLGPAYLLYMATALTAVMWFFNRYFLLSHIGYLLLMIGAAYVWSLDTNKTDENNKKVESRR